MLPVDLNLVEYGQKPLRSKAPQSKNDKVEKSPSMKYKGRTKALPSKIQVGQVAPDGTVGFCPTLLLRGPSLSVTARAIR